MENFKPGYVAFIHNVLSTVDYTIRYTFYEKGEGLGYQQCVIKKPNGNELFLPIPAH